MSRVNLGELQHFYPLDICPAIRQSELAMQVNIRRCNIAYINLQQHLFFEQHDFSFSAITDLLR